MFQFQYFCMSVCTVCCWAGWAPRKQELQLIHWTFTLSFASMSIDDPLPKRVLSVVIEVKACTLNRWRIRRPLSFHRLLHSAVGAAPTWRLSAQTFKPNKFQNYLPCSKCSYLIVIGKHLCPIVAYGGYLETMTFRSRIVIAPPLTTLPQGRERERVGERPSPRQK